MTIRKRLLCLMLAASMLMMGLSGCKDSSNETNTVQVDYNAEEEVAKYKDYLSVRRTKWNSTSQIWNLN